MRLGLGQKGGFLMLLKCRDKKSHLVWKTFDEITLELNQITVDSLASARNPRWDEYMSVSLMSHNMQFISRHYGSAWRSASSAFAFFHREKFCLEASINEYFSFSAIFDLWQRVVKQLLSFWAEKSSLKDHHSFPACLYAALVSKLTNFCKVPHVQQNYRGALTYQVALRRKSWRTL